MRGSAWARRCFSGLAVPEVPAGLAHPCRASRARWSLFLFPQTNPPSLDQAEDLAMLISLNECSVLNTLRQRFRARLPCTYAGHSLVAIGTATVPTGGAAKVREGTWDSGTARGKRGNPPGDSGGGRRARRGRQVAPWDCHSAGTGGMLGGHF